MTNPAYRILITKMAAELDQCHRLLMDDRRQRHPLADYARALLAEPDGPAVPDGREPASVATQLTEPEAVGPTADELIGLALGREPWATWLRSGGCLESAHCELADLMLAAIARWGRPAANALPLPAPEGGEAQP